MTKLIFRADDLGFTEAVNYGILKTIQDGVVTAAGMMPNMPAARHGFDLIKSFDHISLGQHTNIVVGKPCANPSNIPSLVDSEGNFIQSKVYRSSKIDFVNYEEAIIEVEAQLNKFIEITSKLPDYFEAHAIQSENFNQAIKFVAEKHNLLYVSFMAQEINGKPIKFADFPRMSEQNIYDPIEYITQNEAGVLGSDIAIVVFHPGYVDEDILKWSSYTMVRPKDVEALISEQVKRWIIENRIERVNFNIFH
jgi:predicted glycoside hydrolase/deacetylase ChbG (UPF0249 family)